MSEKQDRLSDWTRLKMPMFDEPGAFQYTGRGWRQVDMEEALRRLRQTQTELAIRQAEIVVGHADE